MRLVARQPGPPPRHRLDRLPTQPAVRSAWSELVRGGVRSDPQISRRDGQSGISASLTARLQCSRGAPPPRARRPQYAETLSSAAAGGPAARTKRQCDERGEVGSQAARGRGSRRPAAPPQHAGRHAQEHEQRADRHHSRQRLQVGDQRERACTRAAALPQPYRSTDTLAGSVSRSVTRQARLRLQRFLTCRGLLLTHRITAGDACPSAAGPALLHVPDSSDACQARQELCRSGTCAECCAAPLARPLAG